MSWDFQSRHPYSTCPQQPPPAGRQIRRRLSPRRRTQEIVAVPTPASSYSPWSLKNHGWRNLGRGSRIRFVPACPDVATINWETLHFNRKVTVQQFYDVLIDM